ncbi:MAG: DUF2079 domain-containing protein, partial [Candidatus Roizmanbacteria bacterium]|nr:DUF2079 domain-containing protein [Candidatus Roizmanbacteria bacterium]
YCEPMKAFFKKHWAVLILALFVLVYISYFSYLTILRYHTLYANYFDLGIMHQTVYNTYRALRTGDFSRFLELTNPHGYDQVKRMAIHNDILLAFLAPFYFIYSGAETLLIIQSFALGLGAFAVYGISQMVFQKQKQKEIIGIIFSISYLFFPAMQRANIFEFHAVTLATGLLLFMFYFFLRKKYVFSGLFFIASIFSKEEVALSTAFFGLYILFITLRNKKIHIEEKKKEVLFGVFIFLISLIWFFLSMLVIIPIFRKEMSFALTYYSDFGDSPVQVLFGIMKNPSSIIKYIWQIDTARYLLFLFGPVGFLSLFAPLQLLVVLPEFAINLLSNNWNMRNIIYHYTSVITPFIFISALYGFNNIINVKKKIIIPILAIVIICTGLFSYFKSPLPYSLERDVHPFLWPQKEMKDAHLWKGILTDKKLKIMATGQIAPLFSSRRYVYLFSPRYDLADYVVLSLNEIYNYPEKDKLIPIYEKLAKDKAYNRIYKNENVEVFRKK